MKNLQITLLFLLYCLYLPLANAQIQYVIEGATGDGSSWANASGDLKQILDNTNSGQIWVAQGIYKPSTTDRSASFEIANGVKVYGGFIGNESSLTERNFNTNVTILSGDIGTEGFALDNSYSILKTINVSAATELNGFTIQDGNASGIGGFSGPDRSGAGWYNDSSNGESSPTIQNCIFSGNSADTYGGAIYHDGSGAGSCNSTMINCSFLNNSAGYDGGGLYNTGRSGGNCNVTIENCLFDGNTAGVTGGAIYNSGNAGLCNPTITNTIIKNCYASYAGGGIYNFAKDGESSPLIVNCLFVENEAVSGGGALYNLGSGTGNSSPIIVNSTFTENESNVGGVMYNNSGNAGGTTEPNIFNCIFWDNEANFGEIFRNNYGAPTIQYSLVDVEDCDELNSGLQSNVTCGSGMVYDQDPQFINDDGGNYGLQNSSPAINVGSNIIINGLGVTIDLLGNPRVDNGTVDFGPYEVQDGVPQDSDVDGIADAIDNCPFISNADQLNVDGDAYGAVCDCDDNDPNIPSAPGTTCDDGIATTANDQIQADGCTCEGTPFTPSYCTSRGNSPWVEWISNVSFGDIDNDSAKDAYGDFTGQSTDVDLGGTYTISLTPSFSWPHYNEYFRVWIDYNQDADFTDVDEMVFEGTNTPGASGSTANPVLGSITIPASAVAGATRMRVSMQRGAYGESCEIFDEGEVEDYTLVLVNSGPLLSLNCPSDVTASAIGGATSAIATWSPPTVSSTCPTGTTTLSQIEGLPSGSNFPIGTTPITYQATDDCENDETCSFNVIVESVPTELTLNCPENISITLQPGEISAPVTWDTPTPNTTCTVASLNLSQISGPTSGSDFAIGQTTISYEATDGCNNIENCSFTVNVQSPGTTLTLTCPSNITITATPGATSASASWNVPNTSSNCPTGTVSLTQTLGPTSGSDFSIGTTAISYEAVDNCGNIETCNFNVTILDGGPIGNGYCDAQGNAPWVEWISNVNFGNIDNDSGKDLYGDYTNLSTNIDLGGNYDLTLTPSFSWPHFNEYFRVWIDYNQDEDFSDADEMVFEGTNIPGASGSAATPVNGIINVPGSAIAGTTRMRVAMQRGAYPGPCGNFDQGEVEDYTVVLVNNGPILTLDCPANISVTLDPGQTDAPVSWTAPVPTSTCPTGSVNLIQIAGPTNGDNLSAGNYTVTYEATDDCSNIETCSFAIIVSDQATTLELICPSDFTITMPGGNTSIAATWATPTATSDCPTGITNLTQTSGPSNGALFSLGTTTVAYEATDDCGNVETCSFDITVLEGSTGTYCASLGEQPWIEWIDNVTFGSINNDSNKERYGDFTGLSTTVNQGDAYPISISHVFSWDQSDEYFRVWIDYNGDGDFLDPDEQVLEQIYQAGANGSIPPLVTGNIVIPATAVVGPTRMRLTMQREIYADPCETFTYGEVEDYTVVIAAIPSQIILPALEVLSFSAQKNVRQVDLKWTTNTEFKNAYFLVEKSRNGINFESLEEVKSEYDNAIPVYYQTKDVQAFMGKNYYRLKAVFNDGTYRYSEIEMVDFDLNTRRIVVYPNPAQEFLWIDVEELGNRETQIFLYNQLGQLMLTKPFEAFENNRMKINLDGFTNGFYQLVLMIEGKKLLTEKVVVNRKY